MTVPPIQGNAAASASAPAAATNATSSLLDPNTFLTLLVDELKYQNPFNPSDPTAIAGAPPTSNPEATVYS